MSQKQVFGKDFKYRFTPEIEGERIENIPSHTATASIFTTQPDRSRVLSGDGAEATSTATWVINAGACDFSFDALEDPDPDSGNAQETYFIGIKFKLDDSDYFQVVIRALPVLRVTGTGDALDVSFDDVNREFPETSKLFEAQDVLDEIETQKLLIQVELEAKGFKWASIVRPERLKLAIVYSTLSDLLADLSLSDGDQFDRQSDRFKDKANGFLKALSLEYDDSVVVGASPQKTHARGYIRVIR